MSDEEKDKTKFKANERYGFAWTDPRKTILPKAPDLLDPTKKPDRFKKVLRYCFHYLKRTIEYGIYYWQVVFLSFLFAVCVSQVIHG